MTGTKKVQLLGIGNAIVDILAHVEPDFLERIQAPPGSMTLIDVARAKEIYGEMGPATEMSGGSVGNSVAGFANLGGSSAYVGRVADDQLGTIFNHDMQSLGVDVRLPLETRQAPTARCHVLITPDGQRTMQTYLGACTEISVDDISESSIGAPEVLLLEGYVWDTPEGPASMEKAAGLTKKSGGSVALSLSDDQCVLRHHDAFTRLLSTSGDLVFANEQEAKQLFNVSSFDECVDAAKNHGALFIITRSEKGSVIVQGGNVESVAATPVAKVVDSTGAGDAYTAGFLRSWTQGKSLNECASIGSDCAALVIQQVGARLERGALNVS